jgi:hypothetical protein
MHIPEGRDAIRSWRRLPRNTRRRLLCSTTAHPDLQVAAAAVGYARVMRTFGPRWLGRTALAILWLVGVLFLLFALAILFTAVTATEDGRFITVAPLLWAPFMIWYGWRTSRFQRALIGMENVNAPSLAPARAAAPADRDTLPLVVHIDRRAFARSWGLVAAIPAGVAALALTTGQAFLYVPAIAAAGFTAIFLIVCVLRWARLNRPVLVLNPDGVSFPQIDVTGSWVEIAEVRLLPMPAGTGRRGSHRVIVFVAVDAERIIASAPPRVATRMRRTIRYFGSPLTVVDKGLTHSADDIARAVQALAGLPVLDFAPVVTGK